MAMERFFNILIVEVLPFISKSFDFTVMFFNIKNLFLFKELEKFFNVLNKLNQTKIAIIYNNNNSKETQYINQNFRMFNN